MVRESWIVENRARLTPAPHDARQYRLPDYDPRFTPHDSRLMILRRFLTLVALIFWQGGFTFYAAVVNCRSVNECLAFAPRARGSSLAK